MIYLVAFYAIGSAIAVVIDALSRHWVAAFCVALLSGCAIIAGRELRGGITYGTPIQRLSRCIIALLPLALAVYLSHYAVNLHFLVVPGFIWLVLGALIGFADTPTKR